MADDTNKNAFHKTLKQAQAEGISGRQELLEKLSRMPMEKMVALPATSLAILGPTGLTKLAAMRGNLAGIERRSDTVDRRVKALSRERQTARRSRNPAHTMALVMVAILAAGPLIDRAWPSLSAALLDDDVRISDASRWPPCRRIDRHVDGCVYTSGSASLTLDTVSALTGIPISHVLAANRHLAIRPDTAIERRSRIVIWRGRKRLEGVAR